MENFYVTSEITLNKTEEKRISPVPTNTEFFTYDRKVAKKTINFQLEGDPLDLTGANVILGFHFVNAGQSVIFESADGSIIVEEPEIGKVNMLLPNDIYAYSGSVVIYVYVEFPNGQSLDYPAFSTDFQESWIDQDLEEMAEFYVKRFEDLRNQVLETVKRTETIMTEALEKADEKLSDLEERVLQAEHLIDAIDPEALVSELAQEIKESFELHLQSLEEQMSELQEDLENAQFVSPEEFTETIDQELWDLLSGGARNKRQTLTFAGKVINNDTSNPHDVRRRFAVLLDTLPLTGTGTSLTTAEFETISTQHDETISFSNTSSVAGLRFQVTTYFNLLESFKRAFPEIVKRYDPQTIWEEIEMVERFTANIRLVVEGAVRTASGESSQRIPETYLTYWDSEQGEWAESESHFNNEVCRLEIPVKIIKHGAGATSRLNGQIVGVMYGAPLPGVFSRQADAEIRYIALEYDLVMSLENYEVLISRKLAELEEQIDYDVSKFLLGENRTEIFESTSEGKVRGSLVENPHLFGSRLTTSLPTIAGFSAGTEITQAQYNNLFQDNGSESSFSGTSSNGRMQVIFRWDLLEVFKRRYPALIQFFEPQTIEEELLLYNRLVEKVMFTGAGYINRTESHPFTAARLEPGVGWQDMVTHDETAPKEVSFELHPFLDGLHAGRAVAFFYGPERQTTRQNTVVVTFVKLEFELSYGVADLFIPKGLGAVTMEQFNHLAQRVNDLEKRG